MIKDSFGDRMKQYEDTESMRKLDSALPILIRLDGRAFHTLTKNLEKPFAFGFQQLMKQTTVYLAEETNAIVAYTQSDEISLVLVTKPDSEAYFGGRVQKICSALAAACSVKFNYELSGVYPCLGMKFPTFDCRVWNVPNLLEAANTILWRHQDAVKNSISMAAHAYLGHKKVQGLNGEEKKRLLLSEKNIRWEDYSETSKHGCLILKKTIETPFTTEEIEKLPLKHEARNNPELKIKRQKHTVTPFPVGLGGSELSKLWFQG